MFSNKGKYGRFLGVYKIFKDTHRIIFLQSSVHFPLLHFLVYNRKAIDGICCSKSLQGHMAI